MLDRLFQRLPATRITPGLTIRTRSVLLVAVPLMGAAALSYVWFYSQRVLGLDAYYYVEYTKELALGWPTEFGSNWPRGYPLVAAWITHLGPSPFIALILVSFASLAAMGTASASLLPRDIRSTWPAFAVFAAVFAMPAVPLLLGTPMSELAFSAMLLLAVYFVRHWPARWALWLSLFLGFGAFCIRYAGIFMLGLWLMLFVLHFEQLREAKRLRFAGGWYVVFVVITALMLWSNVQVTGHVSGADRGWGGGAAVIPEQVAHLGWAAIGAMSFTALKDMIGGVSSPQGIVIGWMVMIAVGAVCLRAIVRPKEPMARPLALLTVSYLGAFVLMRAMRSFPDINEPRYFVPVVFPLALILLIETKVRTRRLVGAAALVVVVIGCAASVRGISEETYGDVAFAREALDEVLRPDEIVGVNASALSLSAYYQNAFEWPTCEAPAPPADFIVVVERRAGRGAQTGSVDACGRHLIEAASENGFSIWRRSGESVVLRRTPPAQSTFSANAEK